ncbi:MAG: hypothetical protein ACR2KG_04450 [Nocardioidaceae bacterium]
MATSSRFELELRDAQRPRSADLRADSLDIREHRIELIRRLREARLRGLRRDRRQDRWTTVEPGWWQADCMAPELTDAEKDELYGRFVI